MGCKGLGTRREVGEGRQFREAANYGAVLLGREACPIDQDGGDAHTSGAGDVRIVLVTDMEGFVGPDAGLGEGEFKNCGVGLFGAGLLGGNPEVEGVCEAESGAGAVEVGVDVADHAYYEAARLESADAGKGVIVEGEVVRDCTDGFEDLAGELQRDFHTRTLKDKALVFGEEVPLFQFGALGQVEFGIFPGHEIIRGDIACEDAFLFDAETVLGTDLLLEVFAKGVEAGEGVIEVEEDGLQHRTMFVIGLRVAVESIQRWL